MSNEQKEPQSDKPKTQPMGFWIATGAGIGAGVGVALDKIVVGVALGAAIGATQTQRNKKK